ncbi:MAG TPA: hypothetical protein PLT16_14685, partial [Daejeonella sp.]|nr:hypothetical protein [Daejeonella sp.]
SAKFPQLLKGSYRDDSAPGTFFQPSSLPTCHPCLPAARLNAVKELSCSNSKLWPEFLIINGFMINVLEHVMGSSISTISFRKQLAISEL